MCLDFVDSACAISRHEAGVAPRCAPELHTPTHTYHYCLSEVWKEEQAAGTAAAVAASVAAEQNVLLPFACDFGGLKSAIRVFSKYTNTYLGLPRLLSSGGEGGEGGTFRVGSAYVKLPPSLWQCETRARALARSMILVDYFDLASTSRGTP